ncbi:MAG: C10 family peptidase, partial [FCB group bacterium]
ITNCAEYALLTYFGYKTSLQGVQRKDYTDAQWNALLTTELDANRPVLYAGFGNEGGHCFVCDGYENSSYFHFNWGWAGQSDGYFLTNALNPGTIGTGGGGGGFNSGQQAVIGIEAPQGTDVKTFDLALFDFVTGSALSIYYDYPFNITTNIVNNGTTDFNGDYCAAAFDQDLNFVDFVEILSGANLKAGNHYTNDITFSTNGLLSMLPGDYYIGIFYRPTGGYWTAVADNGNYINVTTLSVTNPNPIELYAPMTVSPSATLTQGQPISVALDVVNYSLYDFTGSFNLSLFNMDSTGTLAFTIEQKDKESLGINQHYTNGLTFKNSNLDVKPGTYLLALFHIWDSDTTWQLTGSTTNYKNPIKVIVQQQTLQPDIYEVNNTIGQAYNLPLNFSNNQASVSTTGSNCHIGTDLDYYKIILPKGFDYTINAKLHNTLNSQNYSLDAIYSYSTDGQNWSGSSKDPTLLGTDIKVNYQGTVYFLVAPAFTGLTGTYLLEINITRTKSTGVTDDLSGNIDFQINPNPAVNNIVLDFSNQSIIQNSEFRIQNLSVLNEMGESVILNGLNQNSNSKTCTIDVSNLPTGVYFVSATINNAIINKKFEIIK